MMSGDTTPGHYYPFIVQLTSYSTSQAIQSYLIIPTYSFLAIPPTY